MWKEATDNSSVEDWYLWRKLERASQVSTRKSRNFRSNKHGPHNHATRRQSPRRQSRRRCLVSASTSDGGSVALRDDFLELNIANFSKNPCCHEVQSTKSSSPKPYTVGDCFERAISHAPQDTLDAVKRQDLDSLSEQCTKVFGEIKIVVESHISQVMYTRSILAMQSGAVQTLRAEWCNPELCFMQDAKQALESLKDLTREPCLTFSAPQAPHRSCSDLIQAIEAQKTVLENHTPERWARQGLARLRDMKSSIAARFRHDRSDHGKFLHDCERLLSCLSRECSIYSLLTKDCHAWEHQNKESLAIAQAHMDDFHARHAGVSDELRALAKRLQDDCAQKMLKQLHTDMGSASRDCLVQATFDSLRDLFLREHGPAVLRNLSLSFPHANLFLDPVPLSPEVQSGFLDAWINMDRHSSDMCPSFHGTRASNLQAIFRQGFLIPGVGNQLKVVNGSAHGLGIYMAKIHAAHLSKHFALGCASGMLVGCVLDDAKKVAAYQCGYRWVSGESNVVRHVGDAMVIFDPRYVAPFFQVRHKPRAVT